MSKDNKLVAFTVDSRDMAKELLAQLRALDDEDDNFAIRDAAFAHKDDRGKIKLEQSDDVGGAKGAFGGGTIGLIAGAMVAGPFGAAVGAVAGGAVAGVYASMRDSGVNNRLMKKVAQQLDAGKTALFILYTGVAEISSIHLLRQFNASLVYSNLPDDVAETVRKALAESGVAPAAVVEIPAEAMQDAAAQAAEEDEVAPAAVAAEEAAAVADTADAVEEEATAKAAEEETAAAAAAVAAAAAARRSEAARKGAETRRANAKAAAEIRAAEEAEAAAKAAEEEAAAATAKEAAAKAAAQESAKAAKAAAAAAKAAKAAEEEAATKAAAEAAARKDDLTEINGIGPKIAATLNKSGIKTYTELSRTSDVELREALRASGIPDHPTLGTWAKQASFASNKDWKGLYAYIAKQAESKK